MSPYKIVSEALAEAFDVRAENDGVRVTTHCVYPSNGFVQVVVRGGKDTFFVSDEGGALQEIAAAGAEIQKPDKQVQHLVAPMGLMISGGVIRSPQCPAESISVAVALVANASKEVADWFFDHARIERQRNFRELVKKFLSAKFENVRHHEIIVGKSNKPHKFENLVLLPNGVRMIFDPVIYDPASINARVVANMDVRQAEYENLSQHIVYDDSDNWKVEDLNLLQVGAEVIPFSKATSALKALAH